MNGSAPSLDDLELLAAIAEAGGLAEAARRLNIPLPTASRRMAKLEQQIGRPLFLRGKAGYALTAQGRAFVAELGDLPALRQRSNQWLARDHGPAQVRITAGFLTSRHLARTLSPALCQSGNWLPCFIPSNAKLDLARREADIGIRNAAPDHPWLARQKLRQVTYAIYGLSEAVTGYVSLPATGPLPKSQRWLHDTHGGQITTTASDTRLCLDLALSGFGRIILPCFAGDAEPGLTRLTAPIEALSHDEWLVTHNDARHDPAIRTAIKAITGLLGRDAVG
ncbi:LysR family transcriptional regulator [Pseudoprimorskyibacter insulae]|uniref:HTH-type transcriptional regulator ArgP n=1 Tax=Pseudoprimorskyibacter insulae TaxID=1695997 RepID=A0A2R8AQ14_9RHOB|nr:LysR family transcriptional regulator [Pseudoprimorskyibacter insulae]SPF77934.1 HTH-type transcriptional regulator ArgP [Pseudoprimorskyibacter insulae]